MHQFTKYQVNPPNGLGGVSEQTHTQTHRGQTSINNIDGKEFHAEPTCSLMNLF